MTLMHGKPEVQTFLVAADYATTSKQYYICYISDDNDVTICDATEQPFGVFYDVSNASAAGRPCSVATSGVYKVIAGGTITQGAWLTCDASGQAIATTTDLDPLIGYALEDAASGEYFELRIQVGTHSAS